MARLPTQRRILREDVKEAPSWIESLLSPLNSFMDSVYRALSQNITFGDNIPCDRRSIQFDTRSDYTSAVPLTAGFVPLRFQHNLKSKPFACIPLQVVAADGSVFTSPVSIDWYEANGTVFINYITGLANSKSYTISVLVL